MRLIASRSAFLCLIVGYVFGCRALYSFVELSFGESLALVVLGGFLIITSLVLFTIVWFARPRPIPSKSILSELGETFNGISASDIFEKMKGLPAGKIAVAAVAVLGYCLATHAHKKD